MLRPRLTAVFASRWKALWWSASILLLAYEVGSSTEAPQPAKTEHVDPWGIDKTPE